MLQRLNFITGVVMLVVAGTLVFVVTRGDEAAATGREVSHAPEKRERDAAAGLRRPTAESRLIRSGAAADRPWMAQGSASSRPRTPQAGQLRTDLRVQVDTPKLQHGDLEERAQRVESFALRRLGMLTEQLDLTAAQQARIFPILVRTSESYDPSMRVVTGSHARPKTPTEDSPANGALDKSQEQELLQQELNPAQSDELVDQSIRDLLVWEEIIDGLTNQLDQATPGQVDEVADGGTSAAPAAEVPVPATEPVAPTQPESLGGRNIFGGN